LWMCMGLGVRAAQTVDETSRLALSPLRLAAGQYSPTNNYFAGTSIR